MTITVEYPQPAPAVAAMSSSSGASSPETAGEDTGATGSSPSAVTAPANAHIIPRPPMPGDKDHHPEWGAGTGGTVGSMVVTSLPVAPYSTADYSLAAVMSQLPLPFCSIRIQYSGAPGSLEAEVSSVESKSDLVVDARVENEGNGWAGSGANPWHLDKNTESILFLTNMSDQAARIGFSITANGIHYYLTQLKLNPHETRAINIRSLRDAQLADFKKNKIPAAASDGSVDWIRFDNVPVMGRLMVITRHAGMSSSYDCCVCACPASDAYLQVISGSTNLVPGQTVQLTADEYKQNCNGDFFYGDWTNYVTWSSSNGNVATVSSTGDVTASSGGSATVSASALGVTYSWNSYNGCQSTSTLMVNSNTIKVQVPAYVDPVTVVPDTVQCTPTHNAGRLRIFYRVLDTTKSPINQANMTVAEQLSWQSSPCATSNGCGQQPTPATWTTDSTGTITQPDTIQNCSSTCNNGGNCDENWQQSFQVNGTQVGIYNGSVTGSVDCISTSCNSSPQGTIH